MMMMFDDDDADDHTVMVVDYSGINGDGDGDVNAHGDVGDGNIVVHGDGVLRTMDDDDGDARQD
eukprot:12085162-Karenia_brevis.AAC.1